MDKDGMIIIFTMLALFAITIGAITVVSKEVDRMVCKAKAKAINCECEYNYLTGCVLIKPNGDRVLLEQLRGFGD